MRAAHLRFAARTNPGTEVLTRQQSHVAQSTTKACVLVPEILFKARAMGLFNIEANDYKMCIRQRLIAQIDSTSEINEHRKTWLVYVMIIDNHSAKQQTSGGNNDYHCISVKQKKKPPHCRANATIETNTQCKLLAAVYEHAVEYLQIISLQKFVTWLSIFYLPLN